MRPLLHFTAFLLILLTVAVGGSRAWGAAEPPNGFARLFTLPDGSACSAQCMFGIQPGVTSYQTAQQMIAAHPLTRHLHRIDLSDSTWYSAGGVRVTLTRSSSGGTGSSGTAEAGVLMIKLERLATPFDARGASNALVTASRAEVMAVLGVPAAIQSVRVQLSYRAYASITYMLYPPFRAEVTHWQETMRSIDMHDSFKQIVIYAQPVYSRSSMLAWRGFGAVRRYQILARQG